MEHLIKFGSAFTIDQFGFVGKGKINIDYSNVTLSGKRHWSTMARVGVFLAITILPIILFGFGLGFLLSLVVIHYFCVSPALLKITLLDIREVKRSGKKITFLAPDKSKGNKTKKSLFYALTEEEAKEIEEVLVTRRTQRIQKIKEGPLKSQTGRQNLLFCPNCGAPVKERTNFCTKCGEKIRI